MIKKKSLLKEKVSFSLNSNCYNTKKEKQKYLVKVKRKGNSIDKIIASNEFVFQPTKDRKYELIFRSIDRDMNYSNPLQFNFQLLDLGSQILELQFHYGDLFFFLLRFQFLLLFENI